MRRSEEQGAERKRSRWYLYSTLPLLRRYFGVRCDSVGTLCRVGTSRFLLALSARLHTTTPIHPGIRALLARSGRGEFRPGPSAENAPETAKRNSTSRIYQRGQRLLIATHSQCAAFDTFGALSLGFTPAPTPCFAYSHSHFI
jgi:hypothetical protein